MRAASSEVRLLRKCLRGNSRAFGAIVAKYQELVCSITFSGTTDFQRSEELAHQTFVNAWENLSQLRDLGKFRPWLCTIARNNIRNFMSKNQRDIIAKAEPMENVNDRAAEESGPLESAISKEYQELVSGALRKIPERYREPLVLYYRKQQSVRRVARLLDLSEEVVKQRLQRGRKMIKEQLSSIVEETLSTSGPKKAFTAAVIGSVAGVAIKASSAAAAAGGIGAAASTAGAATGVAAVMSGITAKVITTVAVVTIGVGAAVTYKQVTEPSPEPEVSQAGMVVQERGAEEKKITGEVTGKDGDEKANVSVIDKSKGNLESDKSVAARGEPAAVEDTIRQSIYVFDDETEGPIAGAELRVKYVCESVHKREQFSTDANGFCLIDFGEIRPSYLSIGATQAGYVPMMFAWHDEMVENIGEELSFYLPKGTKIGGVIENEDSKPIPSATVIVNMHVDESREHPWMWISDYTVTTDANGRWQCDIFPDEPHGFSVKLSHPDYADTRIWVDEPDYKFEDFYSMKSVFVMEEGVLLSGWVTDSEGTAIEGASVFTGHDRYEDVPKTTTDSEGRFEFEHFLPQLQRDTAVLTVQAKGYGLELRVVHVHRKMEPVIISLGPPHTIRVQVVDVNGIPVGGAGVDAEAWRGYRSLSWRSKTDDEGRFVWDEAPADEVEIDIYKGGYMRVAEEVFVAREEEYEIVMLPPLVITGSVVDADTNEPVRNFTATPGIRWVHGGITWETDRYNTKDFRDGRYELIMSHPYPGHLVRIEAEGYPVVKSRVFDSNEGRVSYDFRLQRGCGPSGIVYEPNGQPAAGAEIHVVLPHKYLHFEHNKPSNRPEDTEWTVTDEDGTFAFKGLLDDSLYKLVVIHEAGVTEVSKEQWLEDPNITLQEWGRVEGRLYLGLRPAVGRVHIYNTDSYDQPDNLNYNFSFNAVTDDEGNFVIEQAIPGGSRIGRLTTTKDGRLSGIMNAQEIEVVAGETTYVEIGGGGRAVTGRLIKPSWATDTTGLSMTRLMIRPAKTKRMNLYEIYADIEFPRPENFDEMTAAEVLQWYKQWAQSEEGEAYREETGRRARDMQRERLNYHVMVEPDGNFKVVDVLPGEYILTSKLHKAGERGWPNYREPVAEAKHTFTVGDITEENQDVAVKLGAIEFARARLEPNEPAPYFSVRSVNGGTLNLTDFRGKYLLLTFYMITIQESLQEYMADLKRIHDDFGGDERFEMMGLTQGGMPLHEELAKKFVAEQGLAWKQGIIEGGHELLQSYKIRKWPESFLVGPNGILLANGLEGEELYETVAKALAE